ncbi:recombination protein F [Acetatifactor muris]|uniref:Recombination protein F n=2 Tax=Acetatifactor muris TaxID=879566 RepID=A0A2K4ZQN7_9FIRM|nr:recombination protein F [Acetatifactor muris]
MENLILPQTYILGDGEKSMKIEKMTIDNINGIKHLDLNFNEGLNLICGENGVGKTTVLKAIAYQFLYGQDSFIKKHYGAENGCVKLCLNTGEYIGYIVTDFVPGYINRYDGDYERGNNVIYFSSSRFINYEKIDALHTFKNINIDNSNTHSSQLLVSGVDNNIKNWFINQYIFSKVEYSLDKYQQNNLDLSINVFNLLDKNLTVFTVKSDYEIMLKNKENEIYFEMLSDGYKSCIYILLGIIKEIEYRFPDINAVEFDNIIMIDEIDMHLHPQWQAKLVKVLKETFPKAQIIATTHSPSVLQNAKAEEIIPLYKDENGDVHIKELHLGEYGLQGWTLEEIMKDVMGMESTTSDLYAKIMHEFDQAMKEDNVKVAKEKYELLNKMWHPNNVLRQLLKIQMAGMEE